jgi:E3 ubiquitin-protein ligase RNF14
MRVINYINSDRDYQNRIPHSAPQLLLPFLTAHESKAQSSKFNLASHPCDVCFETLKGPRCLQLICGHVFCRACLKDGWSLYISEGDVARVGCLDPQCVKGGQEATEDEVRRVVADGQVRRWKWLREKKATERGESINRTYSNTHRIACRPLDCPLSDFSLPNTRSKTIGR